MNGRLRTGPGGYRYTYRYDQGGNRTRKTEWPAMRKIVYEYDTDQGLPFGQYASFNNRLMKYMTYDTSGRGTNPPSSPLIEGGIEGGAGRDEGVLLSTTYYYYTRHGNVSRVVTHEEGTDHYTSAWLTYATNGQAVTFAGGEQWDWDDGQPGSCPNNYQLDYVREFWSDGPRQRYANRLLDVDLLMQYGLIEPLSTTWSDYDGDAIRSDYTISETGVVGLTALYQPGMAKTLRSGPGVYDVFYYHADHLGTTRGLSDAAADWVQEATYTAFGELVSGTNHRYGYVGKEGYQAHDEFPFLHVGTRHYDAATGRFLQRDSIGIKGGLNVYAYLASNPTTDTDPDGRQRGLPQRGAPGRRLGRPTPFYPPGLDHPIQVPDTPGVDSWGRPEPTGDYLLDCFNAYNTGPIPLAPVLGPPKKPNNPICPQCGRQFTGASEGHFHNADLPAYYER